MDIIILTCQFSREGSRNQDKQIYFGNLGIRNNDLVQSVWYASFDFYTVDRKYSTLMSRADFNLKERVRPNLHIHEC